jgi:hypothetical protein
LLHLAWFLFGTLITTLNFFIQNSELAIICCKESNVPADFGLLVR